MMAATLHDDCPRCRQCLAEAEVTAGYTGSVGATMVFDDRLVTGEYHAAKWSRDPALVAFLAPPDAFSRPHPKWDHYGPIPYWPTEDPQHDGPDGPERNPTL